MQKFPKPQGYLSMKTFLEIDNAKAENTRENTMFAKMLERLKLKYAWVLSIFSSSPPSYNDGRKYAFEQIAEHGLDKAKAEFEACAGFEGYSDFDYGAISVFAEYRSLPDEHWLCESKEQVTSQPVKLELTQEVASSLVRAIDKSIQQLMAEQHVSELDPSDTLWYTSQIDVLVATKQAIKVQLQNVKKGNKNGHEGHE